MKFKDSELHCTTKYCGSSLSNNKSNNNELQEYYDSPFVAESIGKAFRLEVIGFSICDTTMAAVVRLTDNCQKVLWKNSLNDKDIDAVLSSLTLKYKESQTLIKTLEHGAHAHITLGLASNIRAKQAVLDLVKIKLLVLSNKVNKKEPKRFVSADFELIYLENCVCFVKLNEPIFVNSIFTGHY